MARTKHSDRKPETRLPLAIVGGLDTSSSTSDDGHADVEPMKSTSDSGKVCPICHKTFTCRNSVTRHMATQHGMDPAGNLLSADLIAAARARSRKHYSPVRQRHQPSPSPPRVPPTDEIEALDDTDESQTSSSSNSPTRSHHSGSTTGTSRSSSARVSPDRRRPGTPPVDSRGSTPLEDEPPSPSRDRDAAAAIQVPVVPAPAAQVPVVPAPSTSGMTTAANMATSSSSHRRTQGSLWPTINVLNAPPSVTTQTLCVVDSLPPDTPRPTKGAKHPPAPARPVVADPAGPSKSTSGTTRHHRGTAPIPTPAPDAAQSRRGVKRPSAPATDNPPSTSASAAAEPAASKRSKRGPDASATVVGPVHHLAGARRSSSRTSTLHESTAAATTTTAPPSRHRTAPNPALIPASQAPITAPTTQQSTSAPAQVPVVPALPATSIVGASTSQPPANVLAPVGSAMVATATSVASHRMLTHAALFMASRTYADDAIEAVADRLAARHAWSAGERKQHLDRLRDIRRTSAMHAVYDRASVPTARDSATLDAYFGHLDNEYRRGQKTLEDTEDL